MSKRRPNPSLLKAHSLHESLILFHAPSHKNDANISVRKSDINTLKRISARQLH